MKFLLENFDVRKGDLERKMLKSSKKIVTEELE
jgi:hypothetical protein